MTRATETAVVLIAAVVVALGVGIGTASPTLVANDQRRTDALEAQTRILLHSPCSRPAGP